MLAAVLAAATTLAGCPVFPADSPWNTDVSREPVDPRSDAYIASIGAGRRAHPDFGTRYGIPITIAARTQRKVRVTFDAFGDESDPGPYPIPARAKVEGGSDRHVVVVQRGTCRLFELYDARRQGSGWKAGSGATWSLRSNRQRPLGWTSADAAGLPILPGLARPTTRAVTHALRFTAPRTQRAFVAPARHHAGASTDPDLPPMGLRIRLKASFDTSRFTGHGKAIIEGLKRYGAILADNGSPFFFSGARDPRWDDASIEQLKQVPATAFEAVRAGRLQR